MSNDAIKILPEYKLSVYLSPQNGFINTETKQNNDLEVASNNDASSLNNFFDKWCDSFEETKANKHDGYENDVPTSFFIAYTDSINLYQLSSNTEESSSFQECPLLAIPIPYNIIEEADAESKLPLHLSHNVHDSSAIGVYLSKLLSYIHPALTCLCPCALLRSAFTNDTNKNTFEEGETDIPQKSFQLLILRIDGATNDLKKLNKGDENILSRNSNDIEKLLKIMYEANGKPMIKTSTCNPSAVIQTIPISRIMFYDSHEKKGCCLDESDAQGKFQQTASSNPFSCKSDRSEECNNAIVAKPAWLSKDIERRKSPKSDAQFAKRWETNDDDQFLEESQFLTLELPLCPVCIFRIEPQRLGLPQPKKNRLCTHKCDQDIKNNQVAFCNNMELLSPWPWPSYCKTCHVLQQRLTLSGAQPFLPSEAYSHNVRAKFSSPNASKEICDQIKCYKCEIEETLWVCLTCSYVGCGRYSHGHARQHFHNTRHPFSLELATQRIWDYKTSSFIQRDDLLNCPFMQGLLGATNRAAYHGAALGTDKKSCAGRVPTRHQIIGTTPKKAAMVGEEYEALLQSVLEDQAQHYQGLISRLQADLTSQNVDKEGMSQEELMEVEALRIEISKLSLEIESTSSRVLEAQAQEAGHREKSNSLLREQNVVKQLLDRIKEEAMKEQEQGKKIVEGLEQEISDLKSFISMRQQVAQNQELSNAQICGTSGKQKTRDKRKWSRKTRK